VTGGPRSQGARLAPRGPKATDRCVANPERAGDICQRLPRLSPRKGLSLLVATECRRPTHMHPTRSGPGSAFGRSCKDQSSLEFSEAAENRQH